MATAAPSEKSGKVVIRNIGLLLSGDIDQPILDADTIVINDGLIVAVGKLKDCDVAHARTVIDAHQTCVCPGLIDSHVHPVFGDWTPRQNQTGWIDSTMHHGPTGFLNICFGNGLGQNATRGGEFARAIKHANGVGFCGSQFIQ